MSTVATLLRQLHRWVSLLFTLTVAANFAAMAFGAPPAWLTYAPLLPLSLLMLSGLVLFVQPWLRHTLHVGGGAGQDAARAGLPERDEGRMQ
jgi:hypothetical protein